MAPSLANLRSKIQSRIFGSIASEGTLISTSTSSIDKWGDSTSSLVSSSVISIVPYNLVGLEDYQPFGDLQSEEMDIILPYTVTFDTNDFIDFDGQRYIIKQFEKYPYQGGVLAYAVRVAKLL